MENLQPMTETTCSICLEGILENNNMDLDCRHSFHADCVNTWFSGYNTCPNCRSIALVNGKPISRHSGATTHSAGGWSPPPPRPVRLGRRVQPLRPAFVEERERFWAAYRSGIMEGLTVRIAAQAAHEVAGTTRFGRAPGCL